MIVLIIPVVALGFAMIWVRWLRQPEKPLDLAAQVAAHRRTLAALAPDEALMGETPRAVRGPRMPLPR